MQIRDRIRELRRVPARELRPNARNWRTHDAAQRAARGYAVALQAVADARRDAVLDALERIVRSRRLIGDVLERRLVPAGDRSRFEIDLSAAPDVPFQAVDAIASLGARQARLLPGRPCDPPAVNFAPTAPSTHRVWPET